MAVTYLPFRKQCQMNTRPPTGAGTSIQEHFKLRLSQRCVGCQLSHTSFVSSLWSQILARPLQISLHGYRDPHTQASATGILRDNGQEDPDEGMCQSNPSSRIIPSSLSYFKPARPTGPATKNCTEYTLCMHLQL